MFYSQTILLIIVLVLLVNMSCLTTFGRVTDLSAIYPVSGYCSYISYPFVVRENTCHNLHTIIAQMHSMNISTNFLIYAKEPKSKMIMHRMDYEKFSYSSCIICNNVTSERILRNSSRIIKWNNKSIDIYTHFENTYLIYSNTTIPTLNSTYIVGNYLHDLSYTGIYFNNASISNIDENISISNYVFKSIFNINLDNNILNSIPVSMFINMTEISLSLKNNKFINLHQSFCGPKFHLIYLQYNLLTNLDTNCEISVKYFNISGNALQTFDTKSLKQFPNILYIDVSHNQINELVNLQDKHVMIETLELLSLHHNKLTELPRRVFRCFPKLSALYLQNNEISILDAEALKDLWKLIQLDLSSNFIFNIPYGFFKDCHYLRELSLAGNNIKTLQISTFSGLQGLKVLNISHNYLTHFMKNNIIPLQELLGLDVSNNFIKKMDLRELIQLNGLKYVSYKNNLWNCADLLELIRAARYLYNVERGYFYDVPNIHGIPCSSRNITWPEDMTFKDFLTEIADEKDMENALAYLNAIPEETGNGLQNSDNNLLETLLALILTVLIMDFIVKLAYKFYKCRKVTSGSYELMKIKSQSIATVNV